MNQKARHQLPWTEEQTLSFLSLMSLHEPHIMKGNKKKAERWNLVNDALFSQDSMIPYKSMHYGCRIISLGIDNSK